jgi:hypothetical protein
MNKLTKKIEELKKSRIKKKIDKRLELFDKLNKKTVKSGSLSYVFVF